MSDFEDSDEERYANEFFENESDNGAPPNTEVESEVSENSDDADNNGEEEEEVDDIYIEDDEDDFTAAKLNTGPIKRNNFSNNYTNHPNTDVVPFASSSDEESDVVVGHTLAEINTPSMNFEDKPQTPEFRQFESKGGSEHSYADSANEEELDEKNDEVEDEDEDEEEEFKRIQEMEEKYILQNSAKTPKLDHVNTAEDSEIENQEEASEEENLSYVEDEELDEEEETEVNENEDGDKNQEYGNENIVNECQEELSNDKLEDLSTRESSNKEKIDIIEVIENTITSLKLLTEQKKQEAENSKTNEMLQLPVINENVNEILDSSKMLNSEATVTETDKHEQEVERKLSEDSLNQNDKSDTDDYYSNAQEQETKIERVESNVNNFQNYKTSKYNESFENNVNNFQYYRTSKYNEGKTDTYYTNHFDYRITSKTPSSFNSDEYIFHTNLIKQINRTSSTDKLRPKPQPRKSMSFSNDRMREIERHNQILLRKILNQKPTYNLNGKSSQTFIQKTPAKQSGPRLTNSAVNRKKQQRQIDIDNQILKRKIEAIAKRKKP